MNRHVIRLILACVISLVASDAAGARPTTQAGKNLPAPGPRANDQSQTFDLTDFGAKGDGQADDGPALQAALDALAEAGGGVLLVPAGRYAIVTPVSKDFGGLASAVSILGVASDAVVPPPTAGGRELAAGLDLTSHFLPKTGEQQVAVTISGLQNLLVRDISFTGTPDVTTDAWVTLLLQDIKQATVRHCEFYGVGSFVDGSSVIYALRSGLAVEDSEFLGSGTCSGVYASVVENVEWKDVAFTRTIFLDYGSRPDFYGKLGDCPSFSWVEVGNPAAVTPDSPRREAVFRDVFMDEGALVGLSSIPYHFVPESAPIDLIYVSGLHMNVSNFGWSGHYFYGTGAVLVENSGYGWSHDADAAINLLWVGEAILDRVQTSESATRLRADSDTGRLTVIDSAYGDLLSEAAETKVINTSAPDEDPVQYVRGRFEQGLGREPDAAAHLYWSNKLLRCGEDAVCVAGVRARLSAYLDSRPPPTFAVSGRVSDENGRPLAGVLVELSGSQTVSTVTGADGLYGFGPLPTSGGYNVTASKPGYDFSPGSRSFADISSDQSADFEGGPQSVFGFGAPVYDVTEGGAGLNVTVTRAGGTSKEVSVVYEARGDTARRGADFVACAGLLTFAPGETAKSFTIFITDDSFVEGAEKFTLTLTPGDGASVGDAASALVTIVDNDSAASAANPVDDDDFFVRQHYRDFFSREPDAEGLKFWTGEIRRCGADAACREARRVSVSAAFFLSIEFKETGYLVYRLYRAAYGRTPRRVGEFMLDSRVLGDGVVVGAAGWEAKLAVNRKAFLDAWVRRREFRVRFGNSNDGLFVRTLFENMGVTPTDAEREALMADLRRGGSRADVLAKVVENSEFDRQERNRAFVLMQYFGYLRREADEAPDTNLDGYNYWLAKLEQFGGDYERAEMVKAFLSSAEYRGRFGN